MKRIIIFTFLCLLYSCNVLNLDGSKPIIEVKNGAFDPDTGLDAWGYDPLSTTHVSAWNMPASDLRLTLPVSDGIGHMYNFTIDWGDGTVESIGSPTTAGEMLRGTSYDHGIEPSAISHDYATAGIYTIEITGTFEAWSFLDGSTSTSNDHDKLIRVHSFGDLGFESLNNAFSDCDYLEHFAGGYTSYVTDMSSMFSGASSLTSLDLSSFDTSSVTSMNFMFKGASGLTTLDLSNFDTSRVTSMSSMFYGTSGLTTLDLSNFDTSRVTSMSSMFNGASSLTSLDLTNWHTNPSPYYSDWLTGTTNLNKDTGITCTDPDGAGNNTVNGETCN